MQNQKIKFGNYGILMNGDCLDILETMPDNHVDMVLTDPPYGINFVSNHRKIKYNKIDGDDNLIFLKPFLEGCYRILKQDSVCYCFSGWQNIDVFKQQFDRVFKTKNIIVWLKSNTGMGDLKGSYAPTYELILYGVKGKSVLRCGRKSDIIECSRTGNKLHPTQKPVALLRELVKNSTYENDIVFDGFSGSGSTAVACIFENRRFICIEKNEEYFLKSKERIEKAIKRKQIYGDWI